MDAWISAWILGKYIAHLLTDNWENVDGEILEGIGKILLP